MLGLLLVACLASTSTAFNLHTAKGQLLRGQTAVAANASRSSLQVLGDSCSCQFSGLCSCIQAKEFMKCIQNACDSGACDCENHHFLYACRAMSSECPVAGLKCGATEATCKEVPPMVTGSTMDIVGEIEDLQAQRCKLEKAVAKGFINGKVRIAELEPEIEDRTEALERRGVRVPKLGCGEEDTEIFKDFKAKLTKQMEKEREAAERPDAVALKEQTDSMQEKKRSGDGDSPQLTATISTSQDISGTMRWFLTLSWVHYVLIVLVQLALCATFALVYDRLRRKANSPFAPMPVIASPQSEDDFGVGLFSCFSDMRLCLFALCCPCLRWADTLERAGLLKYWIAVSVFAVLSILSSYTFGITGLVLVFICFRYRQLLRRRYDVAPDNFSDFCAYLFCSTCAVVQEAKVEAFRAK